MVTELEMAAFTTLSWLHDTAIQDAWEANDDGWDELNRLRRVLRIPEVKPVSKPTTRTLSVPGDSIRRFDGTQEAPPVNGKADCKTCQGYGVVNTSCFSQEACPKCRKPMTQREIEEHLDIHITKVIDDLKTKAVGVDSITLSGAITGFLLNTGLKLAVAGGCPQHVMVRAMADSIKEAYKKS